MDRGLVEFTYELADIVEDWVDRCLSETVFSGSAT